VSLALTPVRSALLCAALGAVFVLVGGANLDVGPVEARLGLAAGEGLGPFGQVYGGYEPSLWIGQVVLSQVWAWGEGGTPSSASVRWPSAIATLLTGLVLARRLSRLNGRRAGVWVALAYFASVASIHHAGSAGLASVASLFVVLSIDRILGRGSDLLAGVWMALAFLCGGWPPVVMVLLPIVILGRSGHTLSWRLLVPMAATFVLWSVWVLSTTRVQAWAAALAWPLVQPIDGWLAVRVAAFALPFAPMGALAAWKSVREQWTQAGRNQVMGWLQVAAVAVLAGTFIPGFADLGLNLAVAGLAVAAGAGLDAAWSGRLDPAARRAFLGLSLGVIVLWTAILAPAGGYLAAAVSYYRQISILLLAVGVVILGLGVVACWSGRTRLAFLGLLTVALSLKLAYWVVYAPEWNYLFSKGPWGRAVAQWVLPSRPVYVFHAWPTDLTFHLGRPIRQLTEPRSLEARIGKEPVWVLLQEAEFDHWPKQAPRLVKVRSFTTENGFGTRVLARTEGELPIRPTQTNGYDD
jgi:hypothetical protein